MVDALEPLVREVVVSDPMRTRAIAAAKIMTGAISARTLAHLLRLDYLPRVWQPDATTRHQRELVTERTTPTADRTWAAVPEGGTGGWINCYGSRRNPCSRPGQGRSTLDETGNARPIERALQARIRLGTPPQGFTLGCENEPFRLRRPKAGSRETAPLPGALASKRGCGDGCGIEGML